MTYGYTAIIAAYVLAALLLLGLLLHTRWRWPVKTTAAIAVAALYLVTWVSLPGLLGWPIERDLPRKFRLHSAHVQQPDKTTNTQGAIFLWVTDVNDLGRAGTPRAYRIPYTPPTHEVVINAVSRMHKGMAQMGEFTGRIATGLHDPSRVGPAIAPVRFFDIPDPLFPDK